MNRKQKKMMYRIIAATVIFLVLQLIHLSDISRLIIYILDYLLIGYDILRKAGRGIINGRIFDENFLMALASLGAFALSIIDGSCEPGEAVGVMLFYQLGEFFQSYAVGKSRKNIAALMDIRPDYANIETEKGIERIDPEQVLVGSEIIVQPGEKIPIDGVVTDGSSSIDVSALTGESLPRDVSIHDEVISGSINLTGLIRVCTTREFSESTVSKILELTENASSRKSGSEEFISGFARIYTPVVCLCAVVLACLPPMVRILVMHISPEWYEWIYRALTFLVISCPCALVISIPLSFFGSIGGAGSRGILIKGSNFMETLSKVRTVVCDKTGTLTKGNFEVVGINVYDDKTQEFYSVSLKDPNVDDLNIVKRAELILEYAAYAESASSHPVGVSICRAFGRDVDRSRIVKLEEQGGYGVQAVVTLKDDREVVNTHRIAAGNDRLLNRIGISVPQTGQYPDHGTIVHTVIDGVYSGYIVIEDTLKDSAAQALSELRSLGIEKLVMLTGDNHTTAAAVGSKLGIDEVYSGLLPVNKVEYVEKLMSHMDRDNKLAFVGDGINDAPVLMRSDVGIAMGALGSDAAIEAADVVIMDDDPMKISEAIRISRKCLRIVYVNIVFALAVKLICLVFGALGTADMWLAIFADVGVMVIAVLNSIRTLKV